MILQYIYVVLTKKSLRNAYLWAKNEGGGWNLPLGHPWDLLGSYGIPQDLLTKVVRIHYQPQRVPINPMKSHEIPANPSEIPKQYRETKRGSPGIPWDPRVCPATSLTRHPKSSRAVPGRPSSSQLIPAHPNESARIPILQVSWWCCYCDKNTYVSNTAP